MALDPFTIVSIVCSLGCCLLTFLMLLVGIALLLRGSGSKGSPSAEPTSPLRAKAVEDKPAPSSSSAPVVRAKGDMPDDFSDDFEEDMATVVAPPPPGLGRRVPAAPPPPPPAKPSPGTSESMPPPPRPRSSGQTIIAFDDDFDDEDDD